MDSHSFTSCDLVDVLPVRVTYLCGRDPSLLTKALLGTTPNLLEAEMSDVPSLEAVWFCSWQLSQQL